MYVIYRVAYDACEFNAIAFYVFYLFFEFINRSTMIYTKKHNFHDTITFNWSKIFSDTQKHYYKS